MRNALLLCLSSIVAAGCGEVRSNTDAGGTDAATADAAPDARLPDARIAVQVAIDFDQMDTDTDVTDQFAEHVVFSTTAADQINRTTDAGGQPLGQSPPNILCTGTIGGLINCTNNTVMAFTEPVSNLTLNGIGINGVGPIATLVVTSANGQVASVDVIGAGDQTVAVPVDLTAFTQVTRVEITNITDPGGIGWDDLAFTVP